MQAARWATPLPLRWKWWQQVSASKEGREKERKEKRQNLCPTISLGHLNLLERTTLLCALYSPLRVNCFYRLNLCWRASCRCGDFCLSTARQLHPLHADVRLILLTLPILTTTRPLHQQAVGCDSQAGEGTWVDCVGRDSPSVHRELGGTWWPTICVHALEITLCLLHILFFSFFLSLIYLPR